MSDRLFEMRQRFTETLSQDLEPNLALQTATRVIETMIRHYGAESLYIPTRSPFSLEQRNHRIREDYRMGVSISTLADQHDLSERQVHRILSKS